MTFNEFKDAVKVLLGINLSYYKEKQMKRRIDTLMNRHGFVRYGEYLDCLRNDQPKRMEFIDRLTINVTEFFRNQDRWQTFSGKILPAIYQRLPRVTIWSAACSSGEEPYTVSILLSEMNLLQRTNIIASDIDAKTLERARIGQYSEKSLEQVSSTLINKYFTKDNDAYIINEDLKKSIRFFQHDLLGDSFPMADVIICRNVIIYFTQEAKERIYKGFHKALSSKGVLFVGSTEQIFNPAHHGFKVVEPFFYEKTTNKPL